VEFENILKLFQITHVWTLLRQPLACYSKFVTKYRLFFSKTSIRCQNICHAIYVSNKLPSTQITSGVSLTWQHVSNSEDHLKASSRTC